VTDRLRFHLDEHVDPDIAHALRSHGIDVTTTLEANLRTQSDTAHLDYIRQTGRILITHDADFLRIAAQTTAHPGVAYCHKTARSIGEIIRTAILMYEVLTPDEMVGQVEFL